jgi:hypothetical protein
MTEPTLRVRRMLSACPPSSADDIHRLARDFPWFGTRDTGAGAGSDGVQRGRCERRGIGIKRPVELGSRLFTKLEGNGDFWPVSFGMRQLETGHSPCGHKAPMMVAQVKRFIYRKRS